jgi:hypothetical protein
MKLHWHEQNPWKDDVVYIPTLEEWAEAHDSLHEYCDCSAIGGSPHELMTIEWIVNRALHNARIQQGTDNPKVDAYILPSPSGRHSMGLRIGPEGSQYQSPPCNPVLGEHLIKKYGKKPTP